jgi:membrane associated rhomboid family serine protease
MPDSSLVRSEARALVRETRRRLTLVGGGLLVLWVVFFVDRVLLGGSLSAFGIHPRSLPGLIGVLAAPFLHAGLFHIVANTVPFAVLGFLTTARKTMDFWVVSVVSAISAGLGAWLLGAAGSVHIGASGVVFGYLGFLMGRGFFERRPSAILLSVLVTVLFGGMLFAMLPVVAPGISWQAHLFGWLGGLFTSRVLGAAMRGRTRR